MPANTPGKMPTPPPPLDGELRFDEATRKGRADDFGHIANKATYGRVKAAGGTLYPVSAFPIYKGEWRDHFGSAFGQLDAAKRHYDPDEILTPGYDIF